MRVELDLELRRRNFSKEIENEIVPRTALGVTIGSSEQNALVWHDQQIESLLARISASAK